MKNVFLLYEKCCLYEIVILNYFMNFKGCDVVFCSLDGKSIHTMEGYSVNVDKSLEEVDLEEVECFVVPGGPVQQVNDENVRNIIRDLCAKKVLIAGICAGVDLLDDAGILKEIRSTHSTEEDVVKDGNVITARANGYVDFAIAVAKELNLFEDEADVKETIDFWKNYKRMQ